MTSGPGRPTPVHVRGPVLAILALVLAACGGASTAVKQPATPASRPRSTTTVSSTVSGGTAPIRPCGTTTSAPARYQHVVWIWMENHAWSSVIGSPSAPYITGLAHECATDSNYSSVGSPSLPNYLGATSGSTQGVSDDGDPVHHSFAVDSLFRQVRAAGGGELSFVESMPRNCALVSQGSYAAKHNPAVYYDRPGDRSACRADDVPLTNLSAVLSSGNLPTYTSITPNICHDMHDCSVSVGDRWLATWVPRILATSAYRSGSTALFIVWDEPTPLANVIVAPSVTPGAVSRVAVNHYSLLRTTEQMLGLPLLGAAASAKSLRTVFHI